VCFGLNGRTHLLGQESTELGTIRVIDRNIFTPLGDVMFGGLGHATSKSRHEPGRTVLFFVFGERLIRGSHKVVIPRGKSVLDVVATRERFDTKNVVQMEALITRNGSYVRRS
jgi:hypothetical protein